MKRASLYFLFVLWLAGLGHACAPCYAGTETPPPPAGDVVLQGTPTTGTVTLTHDGVTTTLAIGGDGVDFRLVVDFGKALDKIDVKRAQIAGLEKLRDEANALIAEKYTEIENLYALLAMYPADTRTKIESVEINVGVSTATLTLRGN